MKGLLASQQFGGRWITCDCSFGNSEPFLEQLPKDFTYLAEIACARKIWPKTCATRPPWKKDGGTVEQLLQVQELWNWQTHKISEGEKGPMVAAFARVRVSLSPERTPESERWLLLRNDANGKIKYALSNASPETLMRELVRVSGARWPIERCFQENKSELGLDHSEQRSWTAWHRHMRLVFLAQLFTKDELTRYFKVKSDWVPHPPMAQNQGPWHSHKLYFKLEDVLSVLRTFLKRQGLDFPLTDTDLRNQLRTRPYWVPSTVGHRQTFGRGAAQSRCYCIDVDRHEMGYQLVQDDVLEAARRGSDAPPLNQNLSDPRKRELFQIIEACAW